jgi:hypothetical protein
MNSSISYGEAISLADFIQFNFIKSIKDDADVDSMEYIANICSVYQKCQDIILAGKES